MRIFNAMVRPVLAETGVSRRTSTSLKLKLIRLLRSLGMAILYGLYRVLSSCEGYLLLGPNCEKKGLHDVKELPSTPYTWLWLKPASESTVLPRTTAN